MRDGSAIVIRLGEVGVFGVAIPTARTVCDPSPGRRVPEVTKSLLLSRRARARSNLGLALPPLPHPRPNADNHILRRCNLAVVCEEGVAEGEQVIAV